MLNREHGKTIIMVTHDPKAAEYASRTVHLDKGTPGRRRSRCTEEGAMTRIGFILANLFRKKTRTLLTLLSIVVAFMLFGLLQSLNQALQRRRRVRRRHAPGDAVADFVHDSPCRCAWCPRWTPCPACSA